MTATVIPFPRRAATEAVTHPSLMRRTPFAVIPSRFALALVSSGESTLTLWLPDRTTLHVDAGEPMFSSAEIVEAWNLLRRGITSGRLSLDGRAS